MIADQKTQNLLLIKAAIPDKIEIALIRVYQRNLR
jgi:hypothetical protein